jgi:Haem utilisation ChuX/HutX
LDLLFLLAMLCSTLCVEAFSVPPRETKNFATKLAESGGIATTKGAPTLTEKEAKVYGFLQDLHESKLSFRIVVVGNGAILESTNTLGMYMALSQSPKSGANLVTFASEDKSFELHLQTAEIAKVALVERETPHRTMRILRLIKEGGESICSLIVSDDSETTMEWFSTMKSKYGDEWLV